MTEPSVCVLVLNWNGADDTIECLNSLQKLSYKNARIVVIDNGSSDDSVTRIHHSHPDVEVLQLESNLLYGGGNNFGLKWTHNQGFDFVVFLNNDTSVEPDFLEPLIATINANEKIGMAAPLMCYAATPQKVWYGGGMVNLWTGTIAHKYIRESVDAVPKGSTVTDYITGCCMVMPTDLAVELGGFDPIFLMYGEDADLSLRCRQKGYSLMFVPESRIYHKVSASVGGEFSLRKMKRKMRGLLQIYSRHATWYQWLTIILSQLVLGFKHIITYFKFRTSPGSNS